MNIKQQIIESFKSYETQYGLKPNEAWVSIRFNTGGEEKEVPIWIGDKSNGDGVYFHACDTVTNLVNLCDNGNGEDFMVTKFIKFSERPVMKLYGFINGKIREVHVTELKTFIHSNIADSEGGEVSIKSLTFKAAGIDNTFFHYNQGNPSASNLPKYLRLFRDADTLQKALETDGDIVLGKLYDENWDGEPDPFDCPIVKVDKSMYYRSTDIDQEFYDGLPDNMFYEECQGVKTVCSWRWNGYKPVHEPVSDDDNDLVYDALYKNFNFNYTKNVKWYATKEECLADNKIEIVNF